MQKIWNNPRYRYRRYIEAIEQLSMDEKTKELVLSWFLRLAAGCECKNESRVEDYDSQLRRDEIMQGKYGISLRESFVTLSEERQKRAIRYMLLQEQSGASLMLYGKALVAMLEDGVLYRNRRKPSELLLYLGKEPDAGDEAAIAFANREFMPFGYRLEVYALESFGIIGDDRCMDLDEIVLY